MSDKIWPSWRYRIGDNGEIEGRIFRALHEVPQGWVQSPADAGQTEPPSIDFSGLSDDELREIAAKAGVKTDKRWGRARLEAALRSAEQAD